MENYTDLQNFKAEFVKISKDMFAQAEQNSGSDTSESFYWLCNGGQLIDSLLAAPEKASDYLWKQCLCFFIVLESMLKDASTPPSLRKCMLALSGFTSYEKLSKASAMLREHFAFFADLIDAERHPRH